jgi:serine/threonine protein kinase
MSIDSIADYKIVRSLGSGNHGEFYLAETPQRLSLNEPLLALKVLFGATSEEAFRRATRELRVFASVSSPYLVTLLDAGQDGGAFYYSMEYMPLGSLASPTEALSREHARRAVANAARAAHALHEAGTVHRDIKPANILLHENGARLSDLGLAQLIAPGLTMTGMGPIGSVEYVDPRILRGERASRATDIWSLGVTMHRVLAGTGIYGELPSDDPLLAMRRVLTTEPNLDPSLSAAESALIGECLAPEPSKRPLTAEAVAERIEALDAA